MCNFVKVIENIKSVQFNLPQIKSAIYSPILKKKPQLENDFTIKIFNAVKEKIL